MRLGCVLGLLIAATWLVEQTRYRTALAVLLLSVCVRTDNVLLLLAILAWLAWEKRIPVLTAGLLGLAGAVLVLGINRWVGNYGWIVLFRYSFVAGRYPAQIPRTLTVREYLTALVHGGGVLLTQFSLWLLLGLWAWMRRPNRLLLVLAVAVLAHFLLYPSPEVRYLLWAGIVAAAMLIRSLGRTADQAA